MPISFNAIPVGIETPGQYVEFDNSKAITGLPALPHVILVVGQRRATGSIAAATPVRVTSADQAVGYFGRGSMLAHMVAALKRVNSFTESWAVALDDLGGGAAATGDITFGGAVTAAGTLAFYIAGTRLTVAVASGEASSVTAAAVVAAITAAPDLPVTAAVNGVNNAIVDITARHKGETGNDIDVRFNYFDGEALPAGLTQAITAMNGGTGNPDIAAAIAAIGDTQYRSIVMPYTDAANLAALETELADRWGPLRAIEGHAYAFASGTVSALGTLGAARNSPHVTIMGGKASPTPPIEWAATVAGLAAFHGNIDPARPFQTLPMPAMKAPAIADRFTRDERNILLGADGIATFTVANDGAVAIERLVTTYKTNQQSLPDDSYHDVNTLLTLGFMRFSLRARIAQKFPRYKLADDGTAFGVGQAIVTPRIIRAEIIALFKEWELAGLAEDVDQFIDDLIVERDTTDKNRVNALVPPNIVNQLRVFAAAVQFRL